MLVSLLYFSIDYYILLSSLRVVIGYNRLILIIVAGNRFLVEWRVNIMSSRYMTGTWLVNIYISTYLFVLKPGRLITSSVNVLYTIWCSVYQFDYQFGECAVHNLLYTMCYTQCAVHNVLYTMCYTQCAVHNVLYTTCYTQCAVHNLVFIF
jgi:hypothetical protein